MPRFPGCLRTRMNWESIRGELVLWAKSAGGGLAAALALLTRDRGEWPLAFQHLVYPMLDDRTCTRKQPHLYTGEFLWTAEKNAFGWSCLLGTAPGGADVSPYAAAARATDLSGLPPTFICTGALDLFLEEDLEYARRLTHVGVPVELHVYPGAYHAFDIDPQRGSSHQRPPRPDQRPETRRSTQSLLTATRNLTCRRHPSRGPGERRPQGRGDEQRVVPGTRRASRLDR